MEKNLKLKILKFLLPAFFNIVHIEIKKQNIINFNFKNFKNFKYSITLDVFCAIIFHLKLNTTTATNLDEIFNLITVKITDDVDFPVKKNIEVFLANENKSVELFMQYKDFSGFKIPFIDIKYFSDERGLDIRQDKPGHIRIILGITILEEYFKNNRLHRDNDLPASISWGKNFKEEKWYLTGELNRYNGPAVICYNEKGDKIKEEWLL